MCNFNISDWSKLFLRREKEERNVSLSMKLIIVNMLIILAEILKKDDVTMNLSSITIQRIITLMEIFLVVILPSCENIM